MNEHRANVAADVLDRAADLIAKPGGWWRGDFSNSSDPDEQTGFCAIGAMNRVATGDARDMAAVPGRVLATRALSTVMPGDITIAYYNDAIAKDKRYVIRKMRKAARLLREGRIS